MVLQRLALVVDDTTVEMGISTMEISAVEADSQRAWRGGRSKSALPSADTRVQGSQCGSAGVLEIEEVQNSLMEHYARSPGLSE